MCALMQQPLYEYSRDTCVRWPERPLFCLLFSYERDIETHSNIASSFIWHGKRKRQKSVVRVPQSTYRKSIYDFSLCKVKIPQQKAYDKQRSPKVRPRMWCSCQFWVPLPTGFPVQEYIYKGYFVNFKHILLNSLNYSAQVSPYLTNADLEEQQ